MAVSVTSDEARRHYCFSHSLVGRDWMYAVYNMYCIMYPSVCTRDGYCIISSLDSAVSCDPIHHQTYTIEYSVDVIVLFRPLLVSVLLVLHFSIPGFPI